VSPKPSDHPNSGSPDAGSTRWHWSVFKQIFFDHWEPFQHAHPRYQTAYYDGLVAKMLGCGNPEQMGYVAHRCQQCGQGKHLVSMSCKSSLCLRCAKVYVDNWVSQVSRVLHEGVIYRHIILTVPAMFRPIFSQNAAVLVHALMRCGVRCLDDFYSEVALVHEYTQAIEFIKFIDFKQKNVTR
jgi:hypothetical protein